MNISVTGSRNYPATKEEWNELPDTDRLEQIGRTQAMVADFIANLPDDAVVVSGGARGIDSYAVASAEERGLETLVYPAEWDKYGKGAGFRRNKQIALRADECLVFWDGSSGGTRNFMRHAFDLRRPLYIIGPDGVPWAEFDAEFYDKEGASPRMDIPRSR